MGFSFFGNKGNNDSGEDCAIREIYPLALRVDAFEQADIIATYTKILTDTLERTHGLDDKYVPLLWDNCVQSEGAEGLITLLTCAMVHKTDLFLVYNAAVDVLRKATDTETAQIKTDYKAKGSSTVGVYISFRHYRRTDMLKIYSALEYCILSSLHKTVNISKAVQIKMSELRASTSLADAGVAITQAKSLAEALRAGSDVLLDVKDEITTATANIDPTEKAISFLNGKRAFILDLPISYISGLQTGGIGSTGEADTKAIERGLKQYFFSIVHPVLFALFGVDTEFRSQDFRQLDSALNALKTFDLVSAEIMSLEAKHALTARLFDLDEEDEQKALAAEAKQRAADLKANPPQVVVDPNAPPQNGAAKPQPTKAGGTYA